MTDHCDEQPSQSSRRDEKEQERKRQQGKISCAECHRLKLKCDRKIPCSSCVRRNCESICPTGAFLGGQSSRHLLVEMTIMKRKLDEMSERIRELEDALQASHAKNSRGQHPLLAEELLSIKQALVDPTQDAEEDEKQEMLDKEAMAAFGKLSMSENATELLSVSLVKQSHNTKEKPIYPDDESGNNDSFTYLASEVTRMAFFWPFTPTSLTTEEFIAQVMSCLPSWERATALCEVYLENRAWLLKGIEREQLVEEVMPIVYGRKKSPKQSNGAFSTSASHLQLISLLLSVFAIGASADLTQPSNNVEADMYFYLVRAGLGIKDIYGGESGTFNSGSVTLEMVQTISLLGLYCKFAERSDKSTAYWDVAYVLAGTISLHRDPARWGLPYKTTQRRRNLFWELFTMNNWHSVSFGRPTVFRFHNSDCEFPDRAAEGDEEDGLEFYRWKYLFAKEVLGPISEQISVAWPMKYSVILEMDRRIRNFQARNNPKAPRANSILEGNYSEIMQGMVAKAYPEIILLALHRNFFAKALLEHPADPLSSPFSKSFMAAYRSATALIRLLREQYQLYPNWSQRMWLMRGASLSAVVVIACVVMRTPTSTLAPSAFVELGLAKSLFERTVSNPTAGQALSLITRLFEKAQRALYSATGNPTYQPTPTAASANPARDFTDESPFTRISSSYASSSNLQPETGMSTSSSLPWSFETLPYIDTNTLASAELPMTKDFFAFVPETLSELEALAAADVDMVSDEAWRAFMDENGFIDPANNQNYNVPADMSHLHTAQ